MINLSINISDDGKVGVSGPLHDKILCYGLLETAKDIIRTYEVKENLITPAFTMPRGLKSDS